MASALAVRGRVLGPTGELVPGVVIIEGGHVVAVLGGDARGLPGQVREAAIVAPGFVDLQVNGGFGVQVGERGAIRQLAARLPATGVTAFLPTLVSVPARAYARVGAQFAAEADGPGATPLGLHLEGPLLAAGRRGAHSRAAVMAGDLAAVWPLVEAEAVRVVTLAPERPGAMAWIGRLRDRGVVVSLGHTDAGWVELRRGIDAGATLCTHLYNAMSPLAHRAPGALGAALVDDRVTASLIADGIHVHPVAVEVALRAKGPARVALVTDATSAAAMGPGDYRLGRRPVRSEAGAVRLADGTLAGSVLTMDQAVRNLVAWGTPVAAALKMASEVPARVLGLQAERGVLCPGARADLVLLDDRLEVEATFVLGQEAYRRRSRAAPDRVV